MAFGSINQGFQRPLFDFGAAFVRTSLLSARPAFELRFYNTQSAQLDALDRDIAAIQAKSDTTGATALLRTKVADLERNLVDVGDYKTRTDARITKIGTVLGQLNELNTFSTPATVAEFDAKLAETIDTIEKTEARTYEVYGVNDKTRKHKADAIARLQAIAHNNFATQGDIDAVAAEIATIRTNFLTSQQIAGTNASLAYTTYSSTNTRLSHIKGEISSINIDANAAAIGKIQERKDYYAQILSTLSLAFEASQNIAEFVASEVVLPKKTDPGSVLNLFS